MKRFFFSLRTDKEAQIQARTFALGIVVCFALYYGLTTLFIDPLAKKLQQKTSQRNELMASSPEQLNAAMAMALQKLQNEKKELDEKIAILRIKEQFLREHWSKIGDADHFTKIIFTLLPGTPVKIDKDLIQATLADTRSLDSFEIHPMTLSGETSFKELYHYLQYIESRPEISGISNISIEGLPTTHYDQKARIRFSLMINRLSLRKTS